MSAPQEWYEDNFLVSTNPKLLQPTAINTAFGSDDVYWAKSLETSTLTKLLNNSFCFGVYELPSSTSDLAGRGGPRQIGLARLITDEVSFAYLTDVYILPEYQRKGLGKWLLGCVNEHFGKMEDLRRVMLVTTADPNFYEEHLGMEIFKQGGKGGLNAMSRLGKGSVLKH